MNSRKSTTCPYLLKSLIDLTIWELNNLPTPPTLLGRYTFLKVIEVSQKNQEPLKTLHLCDQFSSSGIRNITKKLQQKNLLNHHKFDHDKRMLRISAEEELFDIFEQYAKEIEKLRLLPGD